MLICTIDVSDICKYYVPIYFYFEPMLQIIIKLKVLMLTEDKCKYALSI